MTYALHTHKATATAATYPKALALLKVSEARSKALMALVKRAAWSHTLSSTTGYCKRRPSIYSTTTSSIDMCVTDSKSPMCIQRTQITGSHMDWLSVIDSLWRSLYRCLNMFSIFVTDCRLFCCSLADP